MAVFAAFILTVSSSAAHGPDVLRESAPPNGSVVDDAPKRVTLWFKVKLDVGLSSLKVFDAEDRQVDLGDGGVDLEDPNHAALIVHLPALVPGTYVVRWRAGIIEDGDVVEGQSSFIVRSVSTDRRVGGMFGEAAVTEVRTGRVDFSTVRQSERKHYWVSYSSSLIPIPVDQKHHWVLHIESSEDGRPIDEASISVNAHMPQHGYASIEHLPNIKNLEGGDHLVKDLLFPMHGWWAITFTITTASEHDRVTFNIKL